MTSVGRGCTEDVRRPDDEMAELAQAGVDLLERQLTAHPPQGVTASDVAGVFQRQRQALVAALTDMLTGIKEKQSVRPVPPVRAVSGSDRMLSALEKLLDDGEMHQLVVLSGGKVHRFMVTPDVDGIFVNLEGRQATERKLDTADATTLLSFLAVVHPPSAGGVLVAVCGSLTSHEES